MRTFEYRLRPNTEQASKLMAVLSATRRLYNDALQELIDHYQATGKYLNFFEHNKYHTSKEHPDIPAVVVDTTLKRLHCSFANFFRGRKNGKRVGFPRFKGAKAWNTIQYRDPGNCLAGNYLKATKHCGGRIRVNVHRPLEGKLRFARIVLRTSGWYVQCVTDYDGVRLAPNERAVGLDMGVTYLVADSDGGFIRNPNSFRASAAKLANAQKRLARCKRGSHRARKAKRLVARTYERIANRRRDKLHKISRSYVNAYGKIALEDLKPASMVKNHSLALSILDASWGRLRLYLAYKAESAGREVVIVPPHYTSQRCSRCKETVQKSLSVRTHVCPYCGFIEDRDTNAALNILNLARTGPSLREREGPVKTGESPHSLKREAP